ncbi:hypothetical protein AABB24_020342 [Solanum stoloniferum]|uniref:Uncharacterized protein n=1 Tax=Solanum stoloniferum TaxID=62892 RepID=A0ABD2T843_9SOLN
MDWWRNEFVWLGLLAVGGDFFLKINGFGLSSWRLRGGRVVVCDLVGCQRSERLFELLGLRADLVDLGKMMENGSRLVAVSGPVGVRWGLVRLLCSFFWLSSWLFNGGGLFTEGCFR